jgi:hypothetical protein
MNLAGPAILFLVAAIPSLTVVAVAMDQNASEPRREIVDINTYPWSSIGKIGISGHFRPQHLHGFRNWTPTNPHRCALSLLKEDN